MSEAKHNQPPTIAGRWWLNVSIADVKCASLRTGGKQTTMAALGPEAV